MLSGGCYLINRILSLCEGIQPMLSAGYGATAGSRSIWDSPILTVTRELLEVPACAWVRYQKDWLKNGYAWCTAVLWRFHHRLWTNLLERRCRPAFCLSQNQMAPGLMDRLFLCYTYSLTSLYVLTVFAPTPRRCCCYFSSNSPYTHFAHLHVPTLQHIFLYIRNLLFVLCVHLRDLLLCLLHRCGCLLGIFSVLWKMRCCLPLFRSKSCMYIVQP